MSNHRLSIGVLRWARSSADYIPEAWRLHRFCKSDAEDELHAFMICDAFSDLVNAQSIFHSDIDIIDPNLCLLSDPYVFMITVLRCADTIECVAKYLCVLHTVFTSVPVIIPPVVL